LKIDFDEKFEALNREGVNEDGLEQYSKICEALKEIHRLLAKGGEKSKTGKKIESLENILGKKPDALSILETGKNLKKIGKKIKNKINNLKDMTYKKIGKKDCRTLVGEWLLKVDMFRKQLTRTSKQLTATSN